MNDYPYADDAEERQQFAEVVERDTREAIDYYTRWGASVMGVKVLEDRPARERLAFYLQRPPILANGLPPADEPGVFPQWYALAAEDQLYYQERVADYLKLLREELR